MSWTKTGRPSHAKNPRARKKKPIRPFSTDSLTVSQATWYQLAHTYQQILNAQYDGAEDLETYEVYHQE